MFGDLLAEDAGQCETLGDSLRVLATPVIGEDVHLMEVWCVNKRLFSKKLYHRGIGVTSLGSYRGDTGHTVQTWRICTPEPLPVVCVTL